MNYCISTTLLLLAGSAMFVYAQAPASTTLPTQEPLQGITQESPAPLQQDKELIVGRLENGLTYYIRPTSEPAGRASIRLMVHTGSLHESAETSGVAHFLEHLVFNGSRHYKRGELIPRMQQLGLGFGGDANAYTSLLHTVYKLDLPNLKDETVDFALTIMRDFADGATLTNEAIDKERGIVISELKARDSEQYRAMIEMLRQMTDGTRVADFMPIGQESVIRNISYQSVRDYYRSHYVPERMSLIITGDITPEQAKSWVSRYFGSMEKRVPLPQPPMGQLNIQQANEKLIASQEQAHTNIEITILNPWERKLDTLEQRIADIPLQLAMTMFARRMERIIRRSDAPFQNAGVDKGSLFRTSEPFSLTTATTPEDWEKALTALVAEFRKAAQFGFSDKEIKEAMASQIGRLEHATKTWGSVSSHTMADALVDCLDEEKLLTSPDEDLRIWNTAMNHFAETPDVFRAALAQEFRAEHAKLLMTGKLPQGVSETQLREAFNRAMQAPIEKPQEEQESVFAYESIGEAGAIVSQDYMEDIGVTRIELSNGVKVNLKPVDFAEGSIQVSAAVDGGLMQIQQLKPGLSNMLVAVMNHGGLEAHSVDELQSLMAGKPVGVGFRVSQDRYTFSGSTHAEHLELQLKLLVAHILHPGYRPDGEIVFKRSLDTIYTRMKTTPEGAYSMQSARALYGDDTRFVVPNQEEIEQISTADVKAAVEQALRTGAIELTLVGDFKVEDVLPQIQRTFGAMPQRKSEFSSVDETSRQVQFKPWGQRLFLPYETTLDKTLVTQIRPVGDGMDYRRNRRLNVLTSIVREKLFDGLRAVLGESYSPSVRLVLNNDFSHAAYISATSAGVKGNREIVSSAMESICNGLGQGNISDEDVERAIKPIITAAEKNLRTTQYWINNLSKLQSDARQHQMIVDLKDDLNSITADEIRALAQEIFGNDHINFFYTVPQDVVPEPTNEEEIKAEPQGEEYTVIMTEETAALPEWKKVADTLLAKYPGAGLKLVPALTLEHCEHALRGTQTRYAAYVVRPEEVGRSTINAFHRVARRIDDDPWGDCIWGIVTGYSVQDAQRIAETKEPLIIKRLLGTTNVHHAAFEHSYCITDWHGSPILEQNGYQEPESKMIAPDSPEGRAGMQCLFARQLSEEKPQLLVTASHATQYNLEMPFGRGLIFPYNNRFYSLHESQFPLFRDALKPALKGNYEALAELATKQAEHCIVPDTTPRVWLAAGNCLFGDAHYSHQSMVITALSAYGCNQVVGYTVPSWYGEGGWGTLATFVSNTTDTTLAEAWFLNNQFILHKTMQVDAQLLKAEFNDEQISRAFQMSINQSGAQITPDNAKDAVGLVHDRDTVAFYGDPAWRAKVDSNHAPAPYTVIWNSPTRCTILANQDTEGRCAIWFPNATIAKGCSDCNMSKAVLTDDFLLIPELTMKKGEQKEVIFR